MVSLVLQSYLGRMLESKLRDRLSADFARGEVWRVAPELDACIVATSLIGGGNSESFIDLLCRRPVTKRGQHQIVGQSAWHHLERHLVSKQATALVPFN